MLITIFLGLLVIGITVVIQGYGTYFWMMKFQDYHKRMTVDQFRRRTLRILIFTASFLIFMHLIQSGVWAGIYVLLPEIDEFENFEKAIYFSLVTFTTLGYGEITIDSEARILAGLEAINGIILIGWSTAFMFSIVQEIIRHTESKPD
jgi:voltage-gated potassium channel Kch